MITNLHIKNIGIIEDLEIDFNNGLNVLTGETGAGKTLIIGSLGIISGGRFSKEMIRKGETNSFVELCMYEPESEFSIDGNIIISREININGRNMCKINGRMVTVNELKEFMANIIDIHGQHDNQTLMDVTKHIELLDAFAGDVLEKEKNAYFKLFENYKDVEKKLKENYGDEKERQRKLDLLEYQKKEIENAKLKVNEDEELISKKEKILNIQRITESIRTANSQIDEVAIDAISSAIKSMEKIQDFDENYAKTLNDLKNIYYELQETGRDINNYNETMEFDEEEIEEIEQRLDLIFSLKRKYGNTIEEILKYEEELSVEINRIENLEEYITTLKKQKQELENSMKEICNKMHEIRQKQSKILENNINKELKDLEMANAKFEVQILCDEVGFNFNGTDIVEFLICTNVGEKSKPLAKIASGGELSRIMLAIKTVLADVDKVPVLVFDEIDTGISGMAANAVAEKLNKIASKHQVICVTHLASIAAKGKYNYFIGKHVENNKTKTEIKQLNEQETIQEIARIASGMITEVALKHAEELRAKLTR